MLLFAVKTDWSSLVWFVCLSGLFCLSLISRLYGAGNCWHRVGYSRAPMKRAWDRAPYSWNMVNLFLFGCHVTERTYASTDCTVRVGEVIKRKGGVSQACLGKSTSFILDIHNMVN